MMNSTGYGPSKDSRWQRLVFNGEESSYELWETKFLGHLRMLKLKDTILPSEDPPDQAKNMDCYAELIQFLDDKSLQLVMREAADNGREALKILREHYANQGKPRIISLYTELTSLRMEASESVTDYLIRAEKAIAALRSAEESLSDGLIVAMILKGLPESFKPLVVHVTQSPTEVTFSQFKSHLRSFEETERLRTKPKADQVMKVNSPTCHGCGSTEHFIKNCPSKSKPTKWCSYHNSSTHMDSTCRQQQRKDAAKQTVEESQPEDPSEDFSEVHSFTFRVHDHGTANHVKCRGILVDTGATSHIVTRDVMKRVDGTFKPEKHYMELADGTQTNNVALKRGDAEVTLKDKDGRSVYSTTP